MKRSEMLKFLEEKIYELSEWSGEHNMDIFWGRKEDIEKLLQAIESAGMLPPAVLLKKTGIGCLCTMREGCQECNPYGKYYTNKWENE